MPPENRVEPLTVANAETDKRTANVQVTYPRRDGDPGQGGWTPPGWAPLVASMAIGVLGSVGAVIALPTLTVPILMGAAMTGLALGLSAFFGIKSAGPRKLE